MSEAFATTLGLPRIPIPIRTLDGVTENQGIIEAITRFDMDVHGHTQKDVYAYIIPGQIDEMILGNTWLIDVDARYTARKGCLDIFTKTGGHTRCWNRANPALGPQGTKPLQIRKLSAQDFKEACANAPNHGIRIGKVTLADIEKALQTKKHINPRTRLPKQYWPWLAVFDAKQAEQLPHHRTGVDHRIPLQKNDSGQELAPPYGPLYGMNREELLVLRKTLTDLLGRNFIRVSKSPAAAPVLLVRKPGGGIRFCVDYRGLNEITIKDRYPLPLIKETLRNMSQAKWFTKLDVIAAFHKIRIEPGEEWKTAFRTRYGLFEWLVTPFGLTGAPATFQRYINQVLREYLDDFVSAYVDDIIIYSNGSIRDHRRKVAEVLQKLQDAGLQCDIGKSEFEQETVKYLGFIIRAGEGICVDPAKVEAIRAWEPPKTTRDVRSFLGFANFYRTFIPSFANLAAPLVQLTRKGVDFQWSTTCHEAFTDLKELFINAPILAHFEEGRETVVETDASGWATGGVLSQVQDDGTLRPCAYLSQKLSPAEVNYEIHDKELLAIIRGLKEWRPELKMVPRFKIITDHKNLRYFGKARNLNERQMRWADILAEFDFELQYRPGKLAARPDALSRREQDVPQDRNDERLSNRFKRIFTNVTIRTGRMRTEREAPRDFETPVFLFEDRELQALWIEARKTDTSYQAITQALYEGERKLPSTVQVKTSLAECHIDERGLLCFRDRVWIPNNEPLRTRIIQNVHDSHITGHPGRDATYMILSRRFFWPGAAKDVRQFLRNCTVCGRSTIWRDTKHGLLKPLPIPQRIWAEISVDFITDLPPSGPREATNCLVITDRLTKSVVLVAMDSITSDALAKVFMDHFYMHHGLPLAIVSDRGSQFVSGFWAEICKRLKIHRRLSTAFHPQTDGATERANQEIERILRAFTVFSQEDWSNLLPIAAAAINNREAASTGLAPFFFTHGYHIDPIGLEDDGNLQDNAKGPERAGRDFVDRLREASDWAQAAIAIAQDRQQDQANRNRQVAPIYRVGDKVWLHLRNISSYRPSKKLDWLHAKYTVINVPTPHTVELSVPRGVHPVFHIDLIRPAASDPLPSQTVDDTQPPPIVVDNEAEWEVEEIIAARTKRIGRGRRREVLVKWAGYAEQTWERLEDLENCTALDAFEERYGDVRTHDGPQGAPGHVRTGVFSLRKGGRGVL